MNDSFCVMPWINISVDPDGSVKPCCISQQFIKKDDGTPYNLGYDKIEDIINSPDYISLRTRMLAGEKIESCVQCYKNESYNSQQSKRYLYNKNFMMNPDAVNRVKGGVQVDSKILDVDLRFGNLCNLSCRSCIPVNSSQLEKELLELESTTNINQFFRITTHEHINDWYQTDTFDDNVKKSFDSIRQLYIAGGEPTIIKKNFEILEYLVETGKSKNIRLVYNSNMTNLNARFYELLPHFKIVTFYASIDGYGDIQEYLRYPSNWGQIDKNINTLLSMGSNVVIKPSPVVQIGNLNKLTDLFEYFENFNRIANKQLVTVWSNLLEFPSHLNIVHLPLEYKKMCWERIEDWINTKCQFQDDMFHIKMAALKNKCFTDAYDPNELSKFFEMNDIFDNKRSHFLKDVNPELYALRV